MSIFIIHPTVGVNADGRLEVFVQSDNEALWHVWQLTPGSGAWSNWTSRGLSYIPPTPPPPTSPPPQPTLKLFCFKLTNLNSFARPCFTECYNVQDETTARALAERNIGYTVDLIDPSQAASACN